MEPRHVGVSAKHQEMTAPAAVFQGSYADIVVRKTRSVFVVSVEFPLEAYQAFVAAFGGPTPGAEVPVALARLDRSKPASEPRKGNGEAVKERRKFHDLPLSQQAALSCNDDRFQRFLAERDQKWGPPYTPEVAAERVREICGVGSRSAIVDEEPSGKHWRRLNSEFMAWVHDVPLAEPVR